MTHVSETVLDRFQVRKSKKQKADFRDWLCDRLREMGYGSAVEETRSLVTSRNVVVGDPNKAELLLGAHYDTCAVMPIPNFITPRNFFCYLVYQLLLVVLIFAIAAVPAVVAVLLGAPGSLPLVVWYAALLFCLWWMMDGKANKHTVNDNTSGVITLLEIAASLPVEQRERVCFVFFDNEERGLIGSSAFFRKHRNEVKNKLLLNFDCVSDGDYIQFYPYNKAKGDRAVAERLEKAFLSTDEKAVEVVKGFGFYPSDQRAFPRGVGVCALKRKPIIGYYMGRIHTRRDTVMEEENITLLRDGVLRMLEEQK